MNEQSEQMNRELLTQTDSLVGRYCHSVVDEDGERRIEWQGRVVAKLSTEDYLVELFEWANGQASVQRIVSLEQMRSWMFYSDSEWMIFSYEHGTAYPLSADCRLKAEERKWRRNRTE